MGKIQGVSAKQQVLLCNRNSS